MNCQTYSAIGKFPHDIQGHSLRIIGQRIRKSMPPWPCLQLPQGSMALRRLGACSATIKTRSNNLRSVTPNSYKEYACILKSHEQAMLALWFSARYHRRVISPPCHRCSISMLYPQTGSRNYVFNIMACCYGW